MEKGIELKPSSGSEEMLDVEDTARLEAQVSLLVDLCAERSVAPPGGFPEAALDVVAHVGRECLALTSRLASTIARARVEACASDFPASEAGWQTGASLSLVDLGGVMRARSPREPRTKDPQEPPQTVARSLREER